MAHYIVIIWYSWYGEGCDEHHYYFKDKQLVCKSCISCYLYDDKDDEKSYKCPEGCKKCSSSDECEKGFDEYYLKSDKCYSYIKNCKLCGEPTERDCY